MNRILLEGFLGLSLALGALTGCSPSFSPDTYSSNAVQQASKVDQAVVIGLRPVIISADATLGTATGAAAGGIAGSQVAGGAGGALGTLGGTVAGGLIGNAVSHTTGDTTGFEYIVKKNNGDLLSVTQKDQTPLAIGTHVLVIAGPQARIVPDYTIANAAGGDAHKEGDPAADHSFEPVSANPVIFRPVNTGPVNASEPASAPAAPVPILPASAAEQTPPRDQHSISAAMPAEGVTPTPVSNEASTNAETAKPDAQAAPASAAP